MFGNAQRAEEILETCGHISEYLKAHRNAWEMSQISGHILKGLDLITDVGNSLNHL
jgi:hypothetical protein